jgi:hypothetical protein
VCKYCRNLFDPFNISQEENDIRLYFFLIELLYPIGNYFKILLHNIILCACDNMIRQARSVPTTFLTFRCSTFVLYIDTTATVPQAESRNKNIPLPRVFIV